MSRRHPRRIEIPLEVWSVGGESVKACPVLAEMFESGRTLAADGGEIVVHSHIPAAYAEALFRVVRDLRPQACIEIGLAQGTSALVILAGLKAGGGEGRLIFVDPNQRDKWRSACRAAAARADEARCVCYIRFGVDVNANAPIAALDAPQCYATAGIEIAAAHGAQNRFGVE